MFRSSLGILQRKDTVNARSADLAFLLLSMLVYHEGMCSTRYSIAFP